MESCSISADTPFAVLASDGVFEFMQDHTVVDLVTGVPPLLAAYTALASVHLIQLCGVILLQVNKYDDCQQGAIALVCEAYRLWLQYETRTDDITAAIIRFDIPDRNHTESGVK